MNNLLRGLLILTLLLGSAKHIYALTEISEDIEGDTLWTKEESPYQVTDYINFSAITPGATLTIEPGVRIIFSDFAGINLFGDLLVNGTQSEPVYISSLNSGDTWRINVLNSVDSRIYGVISPVQQGGLLFHDSNVLVEGSAFSGDLMFFDSQSNLNNLTLDGVGQFILQYGATNVNGLTLEGRGVGIYNMNSSLGNVVANNVDSGSTINVADSSLALEDVEISNSHNGITASNISNLSLQNVSIINSSNNAIIFSGDKASLNTVSIENSGYGVGLMGDTVILNNISINQTESTALQIDAEKISITDSSIINGNNVGASIGGGEASLDKVELSGFVNAPTLLSNANTLSGQRLLINNNLIGVYNGGNSTINRSSIRDNSEAGAVNAGGTLDARENYWGNPGGPTVNPMNPETIKLGDNIFGNVTYEPYLTEEPCFENCPSNIMFLPGIMSSRLYEGEEQLWEGNDEQIEKLFLDENGESIGSDIVTKDLIGTFDAIINLDIYKSTLADLEQTKNSGQINDYEAIAYDWRLFLTQILASGTEKEDGYISYLESKEEYYIENKLRELAASSKSGRVTIIAHSNGGLLTKALINQLGDEADELIDQIILVGVPQLGTPKAIGALLHGYDSGIPFKVSEEAARAFAQNAPTSYQLLPFHDYYSGTGTDIDEPYVTFEDGEATQPFIDEYGYAITANELKDFLTGKEGRNVPNYTNIVNPSVANEALLNTAIDIQESIDSNWKPPENIKVHQIAGTGEYTLGSITYQTIQECAERNILYICVRHEDEISYKPEEIIDGDGTVIVPSALAMSDSDENVERWWVDLDDYNDTTLNSVTFGLLNTKHADILEIDELREFIFNNLVTKTAESLPEYISSTPPELEPENRLNFTLHSPLALSAIDNEGNIVSEEKAEIQGAHYARYGEVQVLTIPKDIEFELMLTGEESGSFTLEIEEIEEGNVTSSSTFSAIPSSTSTVATISFEDGLESGNKLEVDYNGDSQTDLSYTAILGEKVSTPDTTEEPNNSSAQTIGSYIDQQPEVLGVSTDTDLAKLIELIKQLQQAHTALEGAKENLLQKQYSEINNQLLLITNKLDDLLKAYDV